MSHFYVVYDPATGAIRRAGFCTLAACVAVQARQGEAVIAADRLYPADAFAVDLTKTPPAVVAK
ncbi:MAG TPA: hypothetical protein VMU87_04505 [Stellaceae bacterium]|nr:hypothetical protein [Stellaceae bacterium]